MQLCARPQKLLYETCLLRFFKVGIFPSESFFADFSLPFSYHFNFDTDDWNAVYKHTIGKKYKLKAGYDSEVRVGWASIWVCTLLQPNFSHQPILCTIGA